MKNVLAFLEVIAKAAGHHTGGMPVIRIEQIWKAGRYLGWRVYIDEFFLVFYLSSSGRGFAMHKGLVSRVEFNPRNVEQTASVIQKAKDSLE